MSKKQDMRDKDAEVVVGGEVFLRHTEALHFIDEAKAHNLVILAMDFVRQLDQGFVVAGSADYSSIAEEPDAVERTAVDARELILHGLPDGASWIKLVVGNPAD